MEHLLRISVAIWCLVEENIITNASSLTTKHIEESSRYIVYDFFCLEDLMISSPSNFITPLCGQMKVLSESAVLLGLNIKFMSGTVGWVVKDTT